MVISTFVSKSFLPGSSSWVQVTVLFPFTRVIYPDVLLLRPTHLRFGRPVLTLTRTLFSFSLASLGSRGQSAAGLVESPSLKTFPVPEWVTSKLKLTLSLPETVSLNEPTFRGEPDVNTVFGSFGLHISSLSTLTKSLRMQIFERAFVWYL